MKLALMIAWAALIAAIAIGLIVAGFVTGHPLGGLVVAAWVVTVLGRLDEFL